LNDFYLGQTGTLVKMVKFDGMPFSGATVKGDYYKPDDTPFLSAQPFTEIGDGLYYLDYGFTTEGTYTGKFFENGVPSTMGVFRVSDIITLINAVKTASGGGLTIE